MDIKNGMSVKKGDSTDVFKITVQGVSDYTDYLGNLSVLDPDTKVVDGPVLVISPDVSAGFTIGFSPVQTEVMELGDYLVVLEITKEEAGVPVFRREMSWSLKITESLINL